MVRTAATATTSPPPIVLTLAGVGRGMKRLLPVCAFVLPFGLAYGAAAVEHGMAAWQAIVMSATVFAGASQFAALELWQAPLPFVSMALVVLAVNARHIILGAALSPWVNRLPRWKWLASLAMMSDVNFADSQTAFKAGERDAGLLLGGGLIMWLNWMIGTAVGAFAGAGLGALDRFGLDVVMAAFFGAIVVGNLKTRAALVPVAVAIVVALATLPLLPTGWNIIIAALCGGVVGAVRRA